jgi:hypothetical protein
MARVCGTLTQQPYPRDLSLALLVCVIAFWYADGLVGSPCDPRHQSFLASSLPSNMNFWLKEMYQDDHIDISQICVIECVQE